MINYMINLNLAEEEGGNDDNQPLGREKTRFIQLQYKKFKTLIFINIRIYDLKQRRFHIVRACYISLTCNL